MYIMEQLYCFMITRNRSNTIEALPHIIKKKSGYKLVNLSEWEKGFVIW
jgi:hypothetical protein